jgi:hypothetical protein
MRRSVVTLQVVCPELQIERDDEHGRANLIGGQVAEAGATGECYACVGT